MRDKEDGAGVMLGRTDERRRCGWVGLIGELSMSSSSSESSSPCVFHTFVNVGGAGKITEGVAVTPARAGKAVDGARALSGDSDGDRRETVDRFDSGGVLSPPTRCGACASSSSSAADFAAARSGATSPAAAGRFGIDTLEASTTFFGPVERFIVAGAGGCVDLKGLTSMISSNDECGIFFLALGLVGAACAGTVGGLRAGEVRIGGGVGVGVAC